MTILDVFKKMDDKCIFVASTNAKNNGFSFSNLLISQGISSEEYVYIDWHRFDDIDSIELLLLSEYFDDIWYPEADDMYIYDDTFTWFALVTHYGAISITLPKDP